jgi:hypothetical protein
MITSQHLDTVAAQLDTNAREAAHANVAPCDAATFAAEYLLCLADECRRVAMEQLSDGEEWAPADWLEGDSDIIREHANLLGVDCDWRTLWRRYAAACEEDVADSGEDA